VADGIAAEAELVPIQTSGDRRSTPVGDKSRFVKEIEDALLAGEIDVAVHSAKDVPADLPDGLEIACVPRAEDPRDALVGPYRSLEELPEGARVGTSSLRRRSLLLAFRPDVEVLDLRGNVDTRLGRLAAGDYDAIVLALAGLRRLGRDGDAATPLDAERFVPAAGQGVLALETRADDAGAGGAIAALEDTGSRARLTCERAVVERLDATCHTPVGASATVTGTELRAHAYVGSPDGRNWIVDSVQGAAGDPAALGALLAERMLAAGAGEILREAGERTPT
jgi:hydroxymethylbilane synthase